MLKYVMCGRYALIPTDKLKSRYQTKNNLVSFRPNYNVSPGQFLPTIINSNGNLIILMRWGLVPSWSHPYSKHFEMINARAESVTTKPSFRSAFKTQHCLIPASGFFEWRAEGKTKKPYYFKLKNHDIFSFAGIWSSYVDSDDSEIHTYSIITTEANDLVKPIHDRMPVIISKDNESLWLNHDPKNLVSHVKLLKPYSSELMEFYGVSSQINRSTENEPSLIKPIV